MKIENVITKENPQELLPQIVERIFAICKNDENFKLKDHLKKVEISMQEIEKKIKKQDFLLEQSKTLEKDLLQRLEILTDENEKQQIKLLETIGSI